MIQDGRDERMRGGSNKLFKRLEFEKYSCFRHSDLNTNIFLPAFAPGISSM